MPLSGWLDYSSFIRKMAWPCTSVLCLLRIVKLAVEMPGWVHLYTYSLAFTKHIANLIMLSATSESADFPIKHTENIEKKINYFNKIVLD